ncbi:MAG: HAD family hydrolase [Bdellovibrionales bacterium]|nr:HAD family hydrolase [Bdellovibrionales bacterium]
MKKVVFFDRDDTLIVDRLYLNDPDDITYLPHALEGLKRLRDYDYDFVIVTNQSGIARGLVDPRNLREIHRRIRNEYNRIGVDILDFLYAPYLPVTDHFLRKPHPGMLLEAAHNYNIDLKKSWMVGDRMTDVEAGHRAGTRSILLGDKEPPENSPYDPPEFHAKNLFEVCDFIIQNTPY